MKVFISGPMSNQFRNGFPLFDLARDMLLAEGFEVVSPADLDREEFGPEIEFATDIPQEQVDRMMKRDLEELRKCDAIYMMDGWKASVGAKRELREAMACGIEQFFGHDEDVIKQMVFCETTTPPKASKPLSVDFSKPLTSEERKRCPLATGVLDYWPDALLAVANCSYVGNEQHNSGEPMHWAREKSKDHADCIVRHLAGRGTLDTDGVLHAAKIAWRAMSLLQLEIERMRGEQ